MSNVFARMQERQQARLSALEHRKTQNREEKREEETSGYFTRQLEERKSAITCMVSEAENVRKTELPLHFERLSSQCQDLQKLVSDSAIFLTKYDLKTAQKQMADLLQLVNAKQEELIPPKKFSFGSKLKKAAASKPEDEVKVQSGAVKSSRKDLSVGLADMSSKVIAEKQGVKLVMTSGEIKGQDLHLSNLEACEVRLFGAPSTLHMTNIARCTVFCGPVSGSIFVEHCKDCVIVVACQQLRVHSTCSSQFYLHVTSRAIIEDCQELTFAPYSWTYPNLGTDYEESSLDESVNNWDEVDDFNWLASHEPSPNWSVLPQDKRTDFSS